MHEHHLELVGWVGAVTTLGSATSPCLATRVHAHCRVLAGWGRPRPGYGLATASRRAAAPPRCRIAGRRVAPGFKNKTRYTSYVSPENQISHIATNKGNIERQCSINNVLSIENITLDSKQRKDISNLRVKTPKSTGTTDWLITSLIPLNSSNLVSIRDFYPNSKNKASVSTCRTQQI